jgi:hypothetical protein
MGVNPNPSERFQWSPGIHLPVEEIRDGFILEGHMRPRAGLPDQLNILNEQQIVRMGNSKSADFGVTVST